MPKQDKQRSGRRLPDPVTPDTTICIQITIPNAEAYVAAFFAQMDELGHWWAWDHPNNLTDCPDCEEAAQLWRTATYDAHELLDYNIFMGDSVCGTCCKPSSADTITSQTWINNEASDYQTTYNTYTTAGNNVNSIAPNLNYATGNQGNINKVTCLGLNMLLRAIVEQLKAQKQGKTVQDQSLVNTLGNAFMGLSTASTIIGSMGLVGSTAAAFIGGPWLALGLGLAGVGLTVASLFIGTEASVFEDEEAFQDVLCEMTSGIAGEQLTYANFSTALSSAAFDPETPAAQLSALVIPFLNDVNVYLQWAKNMSGLIDLSPDFGAMPPCPTCDDPAIVLVYDYGDPTGYLEYEGNVGGQDIYVLTTRYTGHYSVFSARSVNNVPWKLMDTEVISGTWHNDAILVSGGAYGPNEFPPPVTTVVIGINQVAAGAQLRIWIEPV